MSVEIVEKIMTTELNIKVSIDNYTTNFYTSLSDFFTSLEIDVISFPDSILKDLFVLTITNFNRAKDDYAVAIDKRYIIEYIDNFIKTLEKKEEYEVCNAFLKLKNKYKNLENEK